MKYVGPLATAVAAAAAAVGTSKAAAAAAASASRSAQRVPLLIRRIFLTLMTLLDHARVQKASERLPHTPMTISLARPTGMEQLQCKQLLKHGECEEHAVGVASCSPHWRTSSAHAWAHDGAPPMRARRP